MNRKKKVACAGFARCAPASSERAAYKTRPRALNCWTLCDHDGDMWRIPVPLVLLTLCSFACPTRGQCEDGDDCFLRSADGEKTPFQTLEEVELYGRCASHCALEVSRENPCSVFSRSWFLFRCSELMIDEW